MRYAVGVHVTHRNLNFFQRDLRAPLGGDSDGPVLVAYALEDEIHDGRQYTTLTNVLELVPLLKNLSKVFIRIVVWPHGHTVQLSHENTLPLH